MIIDELFRKKGNYYILKALRYRGTNYNSIKDEVKGRISARTLDHRLNELTKFHILKEETIENKGPIKKKYSITEKGIIVLTTYEMIIDLIQNEMARDQFLEKFEENLEKNRKYNFENIWLELKDLISEKEVLFTLKKRKPNRILNVTDTGIVVETHKGEDKISIEMIEEAWNNLVNDGILYQKDYNKASYRSSFILSLFSELPYISASQKSPISVKLMNIKK
jgi:DNA-binding HxlR family transcriptional regulator